MIPMVRGKEITYQAMSFKLNAPFKADDKTNDTSPSKVNDNRNSYSMNFLFYFETSEDHIAAFRIKRIKEFSYYLD